MSVESTSHVFAIVRVTVHHFLVAVSMAFVIFPVATVGAAGGKRDCALPVSFTMQPRSVVNITEMTATKRREDEVHDDTRIV